MNYLPGEVPPQSGIYFVFPIGNGEVKAVDNFDTFRQAILDRIEGTAGEQGQPARLPAALAHHKVTAAFINVLISTSAKAQLHAQADYRRELITTKAFSDAQTSIEKYSSTPNLKAIDLKDFTKKFFDLQLRHGPADFLGTKTTLDSLGLTPKEAALAQSPQKLDSDLVQYLGAFYSNTFYDRMGNPWGMSSLIGASGPVSISIPDSQIEAAETVLLEFLIDIIDPTPVMVSLDGTTYYPGNSQHKPTAMLTEFSPSVTIPATGCGITTANVWAVKALANLASNEVGAIGGIAVRSPGGFGWSLGAYAKISIGDNQTLTGLLQTAASEIALRATLAATYFSLRNIYFNAPHLPGGG